MKKQIPTDQHITYQLQFRKCGKSSCSTCRKSPGHGPYWYAYWRTGPKLISGYVGKIRPPQYQQQQHRHPRHKLQPARSAMSEPQAPLQETKMEVMERAEAVESVVASGSVGPVENTEVVLEAAAVFI